MGMFTLCTYLGHSTLLAALESRIADMLLPIQRSGFTRMRSFEHLLSFPVLSSAGVGMPWPWMPSLFEMTRSAVTSSLLHCLHVQSPFCRQRAQHPPCSCGACSINYDTGQKWPAVGHQVVRHARCATTAQTCLPKDTTTLVHSKIVKPSTN